MATLRFRGSNCLRQRTILSLLTGKTILIEDIRADGDGIQEFELSYLELIKKIATGTRVEINQKNQRLLFVPGTLTGGDVSHECHSSRSIGFYMEALMHLAPFCKKSLKATLFGVTNDQIDPPVDELRESVIPVMKRFIGDIEGVKLEIKVIARGFKPNGGGQAILTCPVVRNLNPVQFTELGKIKKVRGVSIAARVSPQIANQMVDHAKKTLNLVPDMYIVTDHCKGKAAGLSPGYSLTLSTESNEGAVHCASAASNPKGSFVDKPKTPEDIAEETCMSLLYEISRGGCVSSPCQSLALTMMAFNQKDISTLRFGDLTTYTILYLRHLKEFCGVTFKLEKDQRSKDVIATCSGIGFKNMNRPTY